MAISNLTKRINPATPLLAILPALALIPIVINVAGDLHNGGLKLVLSFFVSALKPSLDRIVLESTLRGLKVTIVTTIVSWVLSTYIGIVLGFISSKTFWSAFNLPQSIGVLVSRVLAIPRAIHELIWGLIVLQVLG